MNIRRLVGVNIAMWALGLASLAAFALSVVWLDGVAVTVPEGTDVPEQVSADAPLAALTAGTARSAETARHLLDRGERSRATHALDAALRAAEVGHVASHGTVKSAFATGLHAIHGAREALHNGRPAAAMQHLDEAVAALTPEIEAARDMDVGVPPVPVRSGYDGAVLVNANGTRLGEVERVERVEQDAVAVLHVGGATDVLGWFEFGSQRVRVPADTLLFGPRRSLGATLVVAPTEAPTVTELAAATGDDA